MAARDTHVPAAGGARAVRVGVSVGFQFGAVSPAASVVSRVVILPPPLFVNRPSMYVSPACVCQLRVAVRRVRHCASLILFGLVRRAIPAFGARHAGRDTREPDRSARPAGDTRRKKHSRGWREEVWEKPGARLGWR